MRIVILGWYLAQRKDRQDQESCILKKCITPIDLKSVQFRFQCSNLFTLEKHFSRHPKHNPYVATSRKLELFSVFQNSSRCKKIIVFTEYLYLKRYLFNVSYNWYYSLYQPNVKNVNCWCSNSVNLKKKLLNC